MSTLHHADSLPPDRFLSACPIRYDCRNLFVSFVEMEYISSSDSVEILVNYPEQIDINYFENETKFNEFINDVKRFAFPYIKTLKASTNVDTSITQKRNSFNSSQLVQFFTFVFTDTNRIRRYGFCRSSRGGSHILCMISYLPWSNIFMNILNKIAIIINEKDVRNNCVFFYKYITI
jgi:hypothetical protein